MCRWPALLAALLVPAALSVVAVAAPPRIAIIIDDLGYEQAAGQRAIDLPGPVAYAVLPGAPRARSLAEVAHASGKEVLLHLPLQAMVENGRVEPGSLVLDMSRAQFGRALREDIAAVPYVIGINTHRGSLLTRHPGHMRWLMDEIGDRGGLFFVDSYTTARSVALDVARENAVPALKRDVFLDPDNAPGTVAREFARLKSIASEQGFAVAIGHPHPATLEFLEAALPELAKEGFELVRISELVSESRAEPAVTASGQ